MSTSSSGGGSLRPFLIWLGVFYSCWLAIVVVGRYWDTVLDHWPIAVAMALGSYVAGSTPMGGGTVGFPVLVLLFGMATDIGRNFSFAIQSVGMTSASILIFSKRRPIAGRFLLWALGTSALATPLATVLVVPYVEPLGVKLLFAVIWASFGLAHLVQLGEITNIHGIGVHSARMDRIFGIAVGVSGGIVSAVTGVGIDMLLYMILVLLFRTDLKIAVPTSVIAMAGTSLIGLATHAVLGDLAPEVFGNWLAAAPVVALGAPFGAAVVNRVPRTPTLVLVSVLCLVQFVWTLYHEQVGGLLLVTALVGVFVFQGFFHTLFRLGKRLAAGEHRLAPVLFLALLLPLASRASAEPAIFTDVAHEVGLDFVHWNGPSGELYFPEIMGTGGALFDADGDGDLDVFVVQAMLLGDGAPQRPPPEPHPRSRLYRNDLERDAEGGARLKLVDVTTPSGLVVTGFGTGAAVGDYDNDGRSDLYVMRYGANQLWHNEGPGADGAPRFRDVTTETGTDDPRWSTSASFFDYDGDGWLDLWVVNYVDFSPANNPRCYAPSSRRDYCGPDAFPPVADRLLRNLGRGNDGVVRFEDVSIQAGLTRVPQPGLGVVARDLDGDGRPEVAVANDGRPNQLWRRRADGSWLEDGLFAGVAVNRRGQPEASMGIAAGDFDRDGDDDLFFTHLRGETNTLYVNDGRGLFEDRTLESGLGAPSLPFTSFGTGFLDVDNDGRLDLVAVSGDVHLLEPLAQQGDPFPFGQTNQLFMQTADGRFEDASARAGEAFARIEVSRGLALGDVDDDGDVDLLLVNDNGPARLLRNELGHQKPWLGLRVLDRHGRDALGARVTVERDGAPALVRTAATDGSFASASDPRVLVGCGDGARVSGVRVVWPGGARERFAPPPLGSYTTLRQGEGVTENPKE